MLADSSKRTANRMKNVYQDDSPGTHSLGSTDVFVQKKAGTLSVGAGTWVS